MYSELKTKRFAKPRSSFLPGPVPQLQWVEIEKLVVNLHYQREIGRRGAANVAQIAEHFDWSKFAPVIVAPAEGGIYAIVDGAGKSAPLVRRYPKPRSSPSNKKGRALARPFKVAGSYCNDKLVRRVGALRTLRSGISNKA